MVDELMSCAVRSVFAAGAFTVMIFAHVLGLHRHDETA